jgi:hypothetical protein
LQPDQAKKRIRRPAGEGLIVRLRLTFGGESDYNEPPETHE